MTNRDKTIEAVAKVLPYRNAVAAQRAIEALPFGTFADEVETVEIKAVSQRQIIKGVRA